MTIKEIAKIAGVSISTVSKIVNNKDQNINPKTRSRVLEIVKEYNYSPYGTVKNLSTAKTFVIGVLLQNASQTSRMLNGILKAAQNRGYSILLFDSCDDAELELKHVTSLCKKHPDGIFWEPVHNDSSKYEHYFTELDIPVCYVNASLENSYCIDFQTMGYLLTQKLIDHKHTQVVCLMKRNSFRSQMVFEGFRKCLFNNQIPYDKKMEVYIEDASCFSKILTNRTSGIVSSHFASALILYEEMSKLHYYLPADLSLVSLKDDAREVTSFPPISSIRIPYFKFGYYVCQTLIDKCEKKELDSHNNYLFSAESVFDTEQSIDIPAFFRSKKIVVVGSINTDYTFNVDQLPQAGKTTTILSFMTALGGKGANQAIGAAKLGRDVLLIGEIGNDTDSAFIIDVLEKEHVSTHGIHRDLNLPTGKAYIYIEKNGEGTITIFAGANENLSSSYIIQRQHLFEKAGYCLLSSELPIETVITAAETAHKFGVKTILKPATLESIPDELYKYIDFIVPNKKEAILLCPGCESVKQQADYLFHKGIPIVIITLGHEGCYLKTSDVEKKFPASDFIPVDTTGGADAFIAGLATYLIEGYTLEKAIRIATYVAGFCISGQGVVSSLPDKNTLQIHIRRTEPDLLNLKND